MGLLSLSGLEQACRPKRGNTGPTSTRVCPNLSMLRHRLKLGALCCLCLPFRAGEGQPAAGQPRRSRPRRTAAGLWSRPRWPSWAPRGATSPGCRSAPGRPRWWPAGAQCRCAGRARSGPWLPPQTAPSPGCPPAHAQHAGLRWCVAGSSMYSSSIPSRPVHVTLRRSLGHVATTEARWSC